MTTAPANSSTPADGDAAIAVLAAELRYLIVRAGEPAGHPGLRAARSALAGEQVEEVTNEDEREAIVNQICEIEDRIMRTPARTLAGIKTKARVAADIIVEQAPIRDPLLRAIMDDLLRDDPAVGKREASDNEP